MAVQIVVSLLLLCFGCLVFVTAPNPYNDNMQLLVPSQAKRSSRLRRIVGGQNAAEGQFPYQVSVHLDARHLCGGSIISANYVVTAAHCLYKNNCIQPASAFSVRAGSAQVNTGGVLVSIAQINPHPYHHWPHQDDHDIALLRLSAPLTFSERIQPIPLASAEPPAGAAVIIAGWGSLGHYGIYPKQLQYNTLNRISRARCEKHIGYGPNSVLCLSHSKGNGTCFGDSGGPAVYNKSLVGIASYIEVMCAWSFPDIYTNVYAFRHWLWQNSNALKPTEASI